MYIYELSLPLTYNSFDFNSIRPDHQMRMGLDRDIVFKKKRPAIKEETDGEAAFVHYVEWEIRISSEKEEDSPVPKREFLMKISGILAHSREEAYAGAATVIHRTCRALSVLLNVSNCNRHLFQPRVEAQYDRAQWKQKSFEVPKEENRQREYVDENGNRYFEITAHAEIAIGMSCEMIVYGTLKSEDFTQYYYVENDAVNYLLDEYYMALGQENIKSKFFHLFSIIEFIEREYESLSGSSPVYDVDDVNRVRIALRSAFSEEDKAKLNRLEAMTVQRMTSMTDFGREQKLVNILHGMGIDEFKDADQMIPVDRTLVSGLIKKRNTYFHGSCPSDGKHISVEKAVTWLMYLCPAIITKIAGEV